jgi:L-glyceraldehyde 3-phosphate reductase
LKAAAITPVLLQQLQALNEIAQARGQSLAQMAISWLLKDKGVTSVLVGVSSVEQLHNNLASLQKLSFDNEELARIDGILKGTSRAIF